MNISTLLGLPLGRIVLFAAFQGLIAVVQGSWDVSTGYWVLSATLTNVVTVVLLALALRKRGSRYASLLPASTSSWVVNAALTAATALLSLPLVLGTSYALSKALWGDMESYHAVLFQPIPRALVLFLLVAYPVSVVLAETPTYFGCLMPWLREETGSGTAAWALAVIFFGLQHSTLPLVFRLDFVFFRAAMYLPFAALLGGLLYRRPSLLPWLAVLHGALDALPLLMLLEKAS